MSFQTNEIHAALLIILPLIRVIYEEIAASVFLVRHRSLWKLFMIQLIIQIIQFFCFFSQAKLIFGLFTMLCWCCVDMAVMIKRLNRPRQMKTDLQAHRCKHYITCWRNAHWSASESKIKTSACWKVWFIQSVRSKMLIFHCIHYMTVSCLAYLRRMCKWLSLPKLINVHLVWLRFV